MNLVDLEGTPLHRAYEAVKLEAAAFGVTPTWSEIVGLVPESALFEAGARHVQLRGFTPAMVLDRRVREAIAGGQSVSAFAAAVASPVPAPGGGSVAAHVGALGAALAQMVAGLTVGRKKYASVESEMKELGLQATALVIELQHLVERDARAYEGVTQAYKLPKDTEEQMRVRTAAIDQALIHAAQVPLETARACAKVAELAAAAADRGNVNAASDAGVAALIAEAACRGAVYNVRINVSTMTDKWRGKELAAEAASVLAEANRHAAAATAVVERNISGEA
jgi:glutamate formiminotransferase / formiminotetrahydrofolate cyclodeaminase